MRRHKKYSIESMSIDELNVREAELRFLLAQVKARNYAVDVDPNFPAVYKDELG
jgi:hypothetical protein